MATHDDDIPYGGELLDFAEMTREEMQAKLLELLTLVETSRELLRANDAVDMARRVLLSAIGVLGASCACVLRYDARAETLALLSEFGLDGTAVRELTLDAHLAAAFQAVGRPRPFRMDDQLAEGPAQELLSAHPEALASLDAAVICPLVGRLGLQGFLVLGRRLLAEGYSARDLELFASLAEFYTLALERIAEVLPPGRGPDRLPPAPGSTADTLRELRAQHSPLREIKGESPAILRLFQELVRFADSRATVLIQGESGTGKELVARAIHELSRRRSGPLEVVDCSSIPSELIESELFGHVRGAFTGAVRDRRGAFDLAHTGTLFLDEIGDMNLPSQTRLLRVLQEGKFRPVGGEKTHTVDVRVVAATNVDLREAVTRGTFRKDLFYRIQVLPLRLPPLREREGDIEVLTRAFLRRFYADDGLAPPRVEPGVFTRLAEHDFPGNVRELQNTVEALAIRSRDAGVVRRRHLEEVFARHEIVQTPRPSPVVPAPPRGPEPITASQSTGEQVVAAWKQSSFNLLEASRQLRARRLEGHIVPVVDRVQLNHYLDGEILRRLERGQGMESMLEGPSHVHRARKRVRRTLENLVTAMEKGDDELGLPRLPEEYHEDRRRLRRRGAPWVRERAGTLLSG